MSDPLDATKPLLGEVLASLGVIDLVCAPKGLDVRLGEVVIYDPAAPPMLEPGTVVLGVGVRPVEPQALELVSAAGAAGAAAVAMKLEGAPPPALVDEAENSGVALLRLPVEMTWSQAHSLWRTAVTNAAGLDDDAAGFPLGDLFALSNAVAAMVGGPVTIEDRFSRVLAYSSQEQDVDTPRQQTILGRRVPDEWLERLDDAGVFRRLWAGEVVRYEPGPGLDVRPRLAVAVRAGDVILGSIWVAEGEEPLGPGAEAALRESARIAALHLIKHRAAADLDRNLRGELLRSLLEGGGSARALAHQLGVDADGTFAVLAFEAQSRDEAEGELERGRALDLVALYGEAFRHRSAAVQLGRTIYVLLPGPDPSRPRRLVELATDIIEKACASLGADLRAGVGRVVARLGDVPMSRQEADAVLRVLTDAPAGASVADFDGVRERVAILALQDFASERPELRSRCVETLKTHDAEHGTAYVETLRAYLEEFGDIPRAARCEGVHPNTFRYRLRRLAEMSGLDLDDSDQRLLAWITLRLGGSR
ncbi:MAG: PucR family transcriptional regulator [Actinomycetota bacterium]